MNLSYASAGVNLEVARGIKEIIKKIASSTYNPKVLAGVGPFASLFELKGYKNPILVASVDGVGTKLKIASLLDKHDTVGIDLVHHCVNDILCLGAEPLFFLDYIAMGKLIPEKVEAIVKGIAKACGDLGLPLIGGETAEMPGVYNEGDYDLVGFILGVVEKDRIIDGSKISSGDKILSLPSSGLHTNGFSLVRKVFGLEGDTSILNRFYPELGRTLGEELLKVHRCYYPLLKPILPYLKGIAHITGGGIRDNLVRILPQGLTAFIKKGSWDIPSIFYLIQRQGVDEEEMYRVFNMGIGIIFICNPEDVKVVQTQLPEARIIGEIIEGERMVIIK